MLLLVDGLHRGEEQHIANGCGVGEQHHQTVDAETQTTCRGQAILQCGDVVVVHLGLAGRVDLLALGHLTLNAAILVAGIIPPAAGLPQLSGSD